jgi:hypothetical protein
MTEIIGRVGAGHDDRPFGRARSDVGRDALDDHHGRLDAQRGSFDEAHVLTVVDP